MVKLAWLELSLFVLVDVGTRMSTSEDSESSELGEEECSKERYDSEFPCASPQFEEFEADGSTCLLIEEATPLPWDHARSTCIFRYDADLVRVYSQDLDTMIKKHMSQTTKNYYIGLQNRFKKDAFHWLDDHEKPTWTNWDSSEPKVNVSGENCVLENKASGKWRTNLCTDSLPYVCQRASAQNTGPPQINMASPLGSQVFYIGQNLRLQCSAYVPAGTKLVINVTQSDNATTTTHVSDTGGKSAAQSVEEETFVLKSERCLRRGQTVLVVPVTIGLNHSTAVCCWTREDGYQRCSTRPIGQVHYISQAPTLSIQSQFEAHLQEDHDFSATCKAYVGTGGNLLWKVWLPSDESQWIWRIEASGEIFAKTHRSPWRKVEQGADGQNLAQVTSDTTTDPDLGPKIISILSLTLSLDVENGFVSCTSNSPHNELLNTVEKTVLSPLVPGEESRESAPRLSPLKYFALLFFLGLLVVMTITALCYAGMATQTRRQEQKKLSKHRHRQRRASRRRARLAREVSNATASLGEGSTSKTEEEGEKEEEEEYEEEEYEEEDVRESFDEL